MKKFAGFTREQVDAQLKWVARHSTGHRFVGTYDEIKKHCDMCEDDEWDYIKDVDVLCDDGQNEDMKKFMQAWMEVEKKHGFVTIPELFEKFGEE